MTLHKELFKDLPEAGVLIKRYENFINTSKDADGYYVIVQYIAEKYGEKAYEKAEEVFKEMGMNYDSVELRKSGNMRRVGYAFDGINVYDIDIKKYESGMEKDIVWLYNREIRKVSYEFLMDEEYFLKNVIKPGTNNMDGLYVAYNKKSQRVGFIHCCTGDCCEASIDALFFLPGRIHECVGYELMKKAKEYFASKNINKINVLSGCYPYPFYNSTGNQLKLEIENNLSHISKAFESISS